MMKKMDLFIVSAGLAAFAIISGSQAYAASGDAQWFIVCPNPLQSSNVGKLSRDGSKLPKAPNLAANGSAVANMKCSDSAKKPIQIWAYRNTLNAKGSSLTCTLDGKPATRLCASWQTPTHATDIQDGCEAGWAAECYTEAMLK